MLNVKELYKLQGDYSVASGSFRDSQVAYAEYLNQCRIFVKNSLPEGFSTKDPKTKQDTYTSLVAQFVDKHPVKVDGYVSREGVVDSALLLEDLNDSMTGASILKEALADPEVDEIQINDMYTIFVQKNGRLERYTDKRGRVMRFSSNDEIQITINKLIDDGTGNLPQFTEGHPILNAKTAADQYRVNAVHSAANTRSKPPFNFPITSVVIRKFKEVKLTINELIQYGAATPKMGRLLTLLGQAELKLFCVGPTGSGKTTLLNIIAGTTPMDRRIILVQNPTEISFMERDEYMRNLRNVVHWEVITEAQMDALISNTLRATPEVIIVGEAREPAEFFQINRAARTGHKILGTYHSEDAEDAIGRFATELSSAGGMSYMEAIKLVCGTVNIIISQFRFQDGTRRIMEIAEILGVKEDGSPNIRVLFEFRLTGEVRINDQGLKESVGSFVQVDVLSDKTRKAFYKAGISHDEIAEFCEVSEA